MITQQQTVKPLAVPNYGEFRTSWISSLLSSIDLGMIELMDKTYGKAILSQAASAARELGRAMKKLGRENEGKVADRLERAFQYPHSSNPIVQQLMVEAIMLRHDLPCSTFS